MTAANATGLGVGFLILVIDGCFWRWKMARKTTPYLLLIGGAMVVWNSVSSFLRDALDKGTGLLSGLLAHLGFPLGAGFILTGLSIALGIYLYKGLHPKSGEFKKSHNVAALVTAVVWGATGGIFSTIIRTLASAGSDAHNLTAFLGQ